MTIAAAVRTEPARDTVLCVSRVMGPTVLPFGPSAGRRGAVVVLGDTGTTTTGAVVEQLWAMNVGHVLFTGEDAMVQSHSVAALTDKLLDRAERHNRALEIEIETTGTLRLTGELRLNVGSFVIRPDVQDQSSFDATWSILRTERAIMRFTCATHVEVREVDAWLMALASNPDGELTRSDHRIHGRRRWLDVRTWVHVPDLALLPDIIERRWNYSPNLWDVTNAEDA